MTVESDKPFLLNNLPLPEEDECFTALGFQKNVKEEVEDGTGDTETT